MKKIVVLIVAVLFAGFVGAQTKTPIKTTDLKKEITDHFAKNYPGYTIKEAFKIETNKVVTFEVKAVKENAKIALIYDNKGAFVKAETPKPMPQNKPTMNKPTQTKPVQQNKPTSTTPKPGNK